MSESNIAGWHFLVGRILADSSMDFFKHIENHCVSFAKSRRDIIDCHFSAFEIVCGWLLFFLNGIAQKTQNSLPTETHTRSKHRASMTAMTRTKWTIKKNRGHRASARIHSKTFDLITLSREIHLFGAFVRINLFIWKAEWLNTQQTRDPWNAKKNPAIENY